MLVFIGPPCRVAANECMFHEYLSLFSDIFWWKLWDTIGQYLESHTLGADLNCITYIIKCLCINYFFIFPLYTCILHNF